MQFKEGQLTATIPPELQRTIGNNVWKGPDCRVGKRIILNPGPNSIPVVLPLGALPRNNLPYETQPWFLKATRSRYAQIGLQVDVLSRIPPTGWHSVQQGQEVEVDMLSFSSSPRPVALEEGARLFRFYCHWTAQRQIGRDLLVLKEKGRIQLDGREGVDWQWLSLKTSPLAEDLLGLQLRVRPLGWIPPGDEPISIKDQGPGYRQQIDSLLRSLPTTKEPVFWLGETPKISLAPDINAFLSQLAFEFHAEDKRLGWQSHSRVIDGGSNWPIRTEIMSLPSPKFRPRWLGIFFC